MIGWLARFFLFLSAYTPLYVAAAILGWPRFQYWALSPLGLGLLGILGLVLTRYFVAGTSGGRLVIQNVHNRDADAMPYLLGYLVPFIDLDFSSNSKLVAMLVIFLSIGLTQVAANLIHLNPFLVILGWHIYDVEDSDSTRHTVIARQRNLRRGTQLDVVTLSDNFIHWEKP